MIVCPFCEFQTTQSPTDTKSWEMLKAHLECHKIIEIDLADMEVFRETVDEEDKKTVYSDSRIYIPDEQ